MTMSFFPAVGRAALAALLLGAACICTAGGLTGGRYSNFGNDLRVPIFPGKNWLPLYANKDDAKAVRELSDARVIDVGQGDWEQCIGKAGAAADEQAPGDAERAAHRARPFCLIDCPAGAKVAVLDPAPQ